MKKIALIIGSMIAGGIISAAGFTWFAKAEPPAEKTSTAERKILFWYDPMYPNTRFDKPGKSPFMDMDLVPKYADEESSASGVRIDPTQTQNLRVKTATVTRGPLTFAQSFPANVSYNEYQYAIVQARAAGFIDKVYPLTVGDKVQKGAPLLDLTIPDWVEAQSEYLLLRETGGTATQTEGILERLRLAGMPEADIRRLIATQKIQTRFTLKAPIDGVITAFDLRAGMNIAKDNVVAKIQGMDPVWVTAAIPESIAWLVKDASQFTLTVPARPDKTLTIRKWTLLPGVDAATRTLQLRLEVDNADEALKPGMNAWLQLNTASEPMLLIPSQALIDTGSEQRVITVDADGRFVPKRVAVFQASQGVTALRSLQDWFLKYELKTIPDVAEVASVGGVVKEYQVVIDPQRLAQYGISLAEVKSALDASNQEAGGSSIELAEAEYMVRASGYLQTLDDFNHIVLKASENGVPVYLRDVAKIQVGPEMRRGIAELNGEVVGGVVILRSGKNAREVIAAVKDKLETLKSSLPEGVEIVTTYDRSQLIDRAIDNLSGKLLEEFIVVAVVCALFLWHVRSALVAIISLPLGLCIAFIVMHFQGLNANIMSLGGIAIAVGAMVDAAIVMIENAHKRLEEWQHQHPDATLDNKTRWQVITNASVEVGPALFISLLIITLSFIPIFTLEGQEGRLFGPLAFTKTYAMAGAALLAIVVIPILMGYWIRGKIPPESSNPLNRFLIRVYHPLLLKVLHWPKTTLLVAALSVLTVLWPLNKVGGEFLPQINEGDLLYMPSTLPGISAAEAASMLQKTDKLIMSVPEVARVFGKTGKAETATDSAPLEMVETTIQLKPQEQWRPGMTMDKIIEELDNTVRLPGLANLWVPPIRNRIDMLSTGIKSPIGIKVSGTVLADIDAMAEQIEEVARTVPGVASALAERLEGGRYINVEINREKAARYGMTVADVQLFVTSAVGGAMVGETVEGIARYPINLRYPQSWRDSPQALRQLPILTPMKQQITLADVADVKVSTGPSMLKTENARPTSWIYIDARDRDMVSVVHDLQKAIAEKVQLKPGTSVAFSGQFELLERANHKLKLMVPMTLMIIFVLLYLAFRRVGEALLIISSVPFALVGGIWLLWWMGFHLSVATGTGFIALAGVAAEFGVVMLMYLRHAIEAEPSLNNPQTFSEQKLDEALHHGAVLRVRPKAMTVAVIIAGLLPILWGTGAGSEVMSRIAAPMIGGMITAPLLSLFIIPAAYKLMWLHRHRVRK
ncbi:CusA/CzcA family heavy metal efflux RND transporter [Escherichia coli]|nr:CusA/CzcA family heavy metal efflux RND transporter [Escherichia coli]EFC1123024.1 CusA/CzcA family heavy metal efflux RND transporter [Escherichia coli]EFQ2076301.1 CusA/CzcA family heavy metal efflux RND transporter [Escherichia coli]EFZ9306874.1 CusA/CzcA family heavy metal efflux RND transporter [Escherichia coli]EGB1403593.1 CusA/CzcA family heavy metal efflux RND transporter [Escherichia coli]